MNLLLLSYDYFVMEDNGLLRFLFIWYPFNCFQGHQGQLLKADILGHNFFSVEQDFESDIFKNKWQ
jgi:hypothetical protein